MGLFVVYQKARETATEVEYRYGKSETSLDRRVVIDKTDPTGPPKECSDDRLGRKVIARVNSERTNDRWPGGGAIQS